MLTLKQLKQSKIVEIYCWKVESTEEMENFDDYPGDYFHTLI